MDLRDYLRIVRKGWTIILGFVIVGVALGTALTVSTTKVYESSAQIFVASTSVDSAIDAAQGNAFTQARVQSYISIANSPSVTGGVIKAHRLALTEQQLAGKITADAPLNKVLINLHVTDTDPAEAARLANFVATQFNTVVEQTDANDATGKPVVKLTTIHPAIESSAPITPNKVLNVGLGLIIGLLIGLGVAVLREVLDNTVKGTDDFEALGVPVLGHVPFDKRASRAPIAFRTDMHGPRSEAYRQLRTNLQFVDVDNPPHIIAVTSAVPGEGKTMTAMNLAAALAETGSSVCLVEADLRRPSIATLLGLVGDVGFTTVVIGTAPVQTVLQKAGRNLTVLTSGPIPPNPSELLISQRAKQVIAEIAHTFDYTIIDTPPLLPVTDGAEMATIADATLLVHRASKTTREQAMRSVAALEKVGQRPVGVILNMIARGSGRYDYGYGYNYIAYRPEGSGSGKQHTKDVVGRDGGAPDGAGHDGAGPDVTGPDVTGPDVTGPDVTGPDVNGPDGADGAERTVPTATDGDLHAAELAPLTYDADDAYSLAHPRPSSYARPGRSTEDNGR